MDAVSYSLASKQAQRIEKFIENPDSNSGIVTVPKVIASGETITIPAGRVAILPNVQIDGVLNVEGEVFIPSGATLVDLDAQLALKAPLVNPAFTNPTATTQAAQDNSTKVATTAYVDGKMVLGTAVNSTSGTSIDFTGIPSWVKKITVMFNAVSTNGSSLVIVRLGVGSIQSTGYSTITTATSGSNTIAAASFTDAFSTDAVVAANSYNRHGSIIFTKMDLSNKWSAIGSIANPNINASYICGNVTLSGTLDRIRITTANGTDTFDAGSINIMYEG